ncbi:hypothetical protein K7432_009798 [Basidiobolus ranarum]|uniref:DIS3-like exonuclease 2 n=1 Tax=Basidiobolus ranarum TaxID=34480 RepID=A0ABR2WPN9_9FUNG
MNSYYQTHNERLGQPKAHNNSREDSRYESDSYYPNSNHSASTLANSQSRNFNYQKEDSHRRLASRAYGLELNVDNLDENSYLPFDKINEERYNSHSQFRGSSHYSNGPNPNFIPTGLNPPMNLNTRRNSLPFGNSRNHDHYRLARLETHLHLPGLGDLHSPELAQPILPNFLLSGEYDSPDLEHSIYGNINGNTPGRQPWTEASSSHYPSGQLHFPSNHQENARLGMRAPIEQLDSYAPFKSNGYTSNKMMNGSYTMGENIRAPQEKNGTMELKYQANQILSMLHSKTPSQDMCQEQTSFHTAGSSFRQFGYDQSRKFLYDRYCSEEVLTEGLQLGTILKGTLRINKRNRSDAYVTTEELDQDVYICGSRLRNRGLEGDTVAITLLDQQKVLEIRQQRNRDAEKRGRKIKCTEKEENDAEPKYYGQVVSILQRGGGNVYSGALMLNRPNSKCNESEDQQTNKVRENDSKAFHKKPRIVWFKPSDKRLPLMVLPIDEAPHNFMEKHLEYANQIFLVSIKRWPPTTLHPFATLVGELGQVGNIEAETAAILADCDIASENFDEGVQGCLPSMPWSIPDSEYQSRKDLREDRLFTIDPSTAKDLDDAVSCKRLDDGNYLIGAHIADVSYFVRPGTPLDREARKRATSVYLIQKVIPMLPPVLCEELCSLNPGVDRLAFSVMWKMTPDARIIDMWCGRTVIKSCGKLSYEAAQNVIDGNHLDMGVKIYDQSREEVEEDIRTFHKLSLALRKMRFDNGALSIDSIRLAFQLDQSSTPTSCSVYKTQDSNHLIEEFMLLANITVAQLISSAYPEQALLRRHASPIERRMNDFVKSARNLGYEIDPENSGTLQRSLAGIDSQEAQQILKILCIKPMQRAKYICTGTMDESNFKHFALNIPFYTHFTSPIRRYADIIVHRTLQQALIGSPRFFLSKDEVQKAAAQCNVKKDNAKAAQEMSSQLYLSYYLNSLIEKHGEIECDAVVIDVHDSSFDVLVPSYGLEKRIHLEKLPLRNAIFKSEDFKELSLFWNTSKDMGQEESKVGEDTEEDLTEEYEELLTDDSDELDLESLTLKREENIIEKLYPDTPRSFSNDSVSEISNSPASSESSKIRFTSSDSVSSYSSSPKSVALDDLDICGNSLGLLDHVVSKHEEICQESCVQNLRIFDHLRVCITVDIQRSPALIGVIAKNPFQ